MSRQSRILVVLAIFAIAAVVVLAMMARHYSRILERRQISAPIERRAEPPTTEPSAPAPEPASRPTAAPAESAGPS
jgi:hypothetical protein